MTVEPKLVELQPFTVDGISVRTSNAAEGEGSTAQLPSLWGRFFAQQLADRIPNRSPNSPVYGVYSQYESDASGPYSVTAGVAVSDEPTEPTSIRINGGNYLVFEAKGPMPQAVIDAWTDVWEYFAKTSRHRRSFTTDFEAYTSPDAVAIHIALA